MVLFLRLVGAFLVWAVLGVAVFWALKWYLEKTEPVGPPLHPDDARDTWLDPGVRVN